jgi:hypothetical protein
MGEEPLIRAGADFKRAGGIKGLGFKVEAQSFNVQFAAEPLRLK